MPLLEPIMKGLIEWIYEMVVGIMEYAAKELVGVMSMDMAYFEQTAPVIKDITNIILALGWGMLIANMVFQSTKAMMSGVGFESEDPKHIFCRTFFNLFFISYPPFKNIMILKIMYPIQNTVASGTLFSDLT